MGVWKYEAGLYMLVALACQPLGNDCCRQYGLDAQGYKAILRRRVGLVCQSTISTRCNVYAHLYL